MLPGPITCAAPYLNGLGPVLPCISPARQALKAAHSTRGLQDVFYGIRMARKGWLTKEDVINCLPLGKVEAALKAKRKRP